MSECRATARIVKLQSTKLLQSVRRSDVSQLATIVDRGVPQLVNTLHPIYDNSALIVASSEGNAVILDLLLSQGADPRLEDSEGRSALMYAARNGHVDCVTRLIESGASVTKQDHTACGILCVFRQKKSLPHKP